MSENKCYWYLIKEEASIILHQGEFLVVVEFTTESEFWE